VATVKLIVNPDELARVATWRDGKAGAMTVWIDDSHGVAFDKLNTNGFAGTYALWGLQPIPGFFTNYYLAGMEMAGHTHDHPCFEVNEPTRRYEIEENSREILARTPATQTELISFAWPCGHTTTKEQVWASDYYLIARGYNINLLEDASPQNWMNLKSFNSDDTVPLPPSDLKTVVDAAITQGKWANLVFHSTDNDDGAISYAVGKDIWVDRADRVSKYVHQRDRTIITNYSVSSSLIQFNTYRLPVDPSPVRSFETAINTNDTLTFTIDVSGYSGMFVSSVLLDGGGTTFTRNGNLVFFNTLVTTNTQTVAVNFLTNTAPTLPAQVGVSVDESSLLTITNTATDSDIPAQSLSYSLTVTNTLNGNVQTNASINTNGVISWTPSETQGAGTYSFMTVVADSGITPSTTTNSFIVTVNELNAPPTLPSQPDQMVFGTALATIINTASDSDVPANSLGYLLTVTNLSGNTVVTNASISAGGVISWTPTIAQLPSTNLFTTVVTDTNTAATNDQSLSATNTFIVIALESPLVLPAQTNQVIDELTSVIITNTALNLTNQSRSGWITTNRIAFSDYTNSVSLLSDGWSFWATNGGVGRDTQITDTNVGVITFGQTNAAIGTAMRVPTNLGDPWSSLNDTRNTLFRELSTNWLSTRLKLAFDPATDYQQAHLVLYQNDDNYIEVGVGYNSGSKNMFFIQEVGGTPSVISSVTATSSNLLLRLDRNPANGNISALFSTDETNWVALGEISHSLTNVRLGMWSGAATSPYATTLQHCDFAFLDVVTTNSMPPLIYTLAVTNTSDNSVATNVSINNLGVINWTPTEAQGPGIYSFTTAVNEGALNIMNTFTVTVNEDRKSVV
jgi:regulation of enolase protein 1 (concanavalin A-like superfamily)